MPKKIIILLMLICFHITASGKHDLDEEVIKNQGPFTASTRNDFDEEVIKNQRPFTASDKHSLEEEAIRNRGPFIEHISTGLPKKIAMAATTTFCIFVDATTMIRVLPRIVGIDLVYGMMTSSAAVLFPEALEGPLTSKKWSKIIANGFCTASILFLPKTAIGSYAFAYIVNETAKYSKIDPINRAALTYFGGRLGGFFTQYLFQQLSYVL